MRHFSADNHIPVLLPMGSRSMGELQDKNNNNMIQIPAQLQAQKSQLGSSVRYPVHVKHQSSFQSFSKLQPLSMFPATKGHAKRS